MRANRRGEEPQQVAERVVDEHVERAERPVHLADQPRQLLGARDVLRLDRNAFRAALAQHGQRIAAGSLVLDIVDRDGGAPLGQAKSDPATDAS